MTNRRTGFHLVVAVTMLLIASAAPAYAMTCTTTQIDDRRFNGIDGSGEDNVIGVGNKGRIARFDGSAWTQMSSPTSEDLNDVHTIAAGSAFAVGDDGAVIELSGTSWTEHSAFTGEDLYGVWAAGANEVWVSGKDGTLWFYDGSVWLDVSTAAGVNNEDLVDIWGDAGAVVVLGEDGRLYRYDRASGSWDAPDTACTFDDKYDDLWGDGAGNLYLVRKKDVNLHDGASCSNVAEADENLRGVSGSSATGEVYAVGKKGEVMYFDGAAWMRSQEGSEDLLDVWVSANGSAYYAGKKGELTVCAVEVANVLGDWSLDDCGIGTAGASVLDASGNALHGTTVGAISPVADGPVCQAAGLDGSSNYVSIGNDPLLDLTDGIGFAVWIRKGSAAPRAWETIFAKGDSAYRLHLNGGCAMPSDAGGNVSRGITFGLNGGCNNADLNSNVVPTVGTWMHVAGSYDGTRMAIYIDGVLANASDFSAPIATNNFGFAIGNNLQQGGRRWNGDIDELTLWDNAITIDDVIAHRDRTRPCTSCGGTEFIVNHDNYGLYCLSETVQVDVVNDATGAPRNDYSEAITLDTGNGNGTWSLLSGGGTFDDATAADGLASYLWPTGESTATFALSYPGGPASLNVNVFETANPTVRDQDGEGALTFSASGFTVTDAPLGNPPPSSVAPFGGVRVAGTDMNLYLTAYGQLPGDAQCGVIESYDGARDLAFWSVYDNPASGTRAVSIDGAAIAASEPAAGTQSVSFSNGQAVVAAKYKDAGSIQIALKDASPHPDLPNGIRGATAAFVVKPDRFELSGIADAAGVPNPGAANAAGAVFMTAGAPFRVTVTALDAEGDATPNFGRETSPESVALTATLVAPAGGNNPALVAPVGFGSFTGGAATATDYAWPEVGIVSLSPAVADGDYLGGGNVTGPASGNVGRFVPERLEASVNSPSWRTACAAGGFTYLGQGFGYAVAPQITVTARAVGGGITANYRDDFFKLSTATVQNRLYTGGAQTLDASGLPPASSDPVVADSGGGTGTLTFDAGTGLAFARTSVQAPFDAQIGLSLDVIDADGVTSPSNPVSFGSAMAFDAGASMRYGRLRFVNAVGSERVDLPLALRAEVYAGSGSGFVSHAADACTGAVTLTLGSYGGDLGAGETCVRDTGSPGASGAGCVAAAPPSQRFATPPVAGDFNLILAAPGSGNDGTVTVTGDAPAWLEFDWDATAPGIEDPSGTATFGVFSGNGRRIFSREVY